MGHGTVADLGEVPEFLARIRHGRAPGPELVREVQRRYQAIGGSPLLTTTLAVARALSAFIELPCEVAMRFSAPSVEDALRRLSAVSETVCVLPLAPYSVGLYVEVVRAAAERSSARLDLVPVAPFGEHPKLVAAHARKIAPLLAGREPSDTELVFTAHSLPTRVIQSGDAYQREFEASARAIASALSWPVTIAYQSVGAGGGEWLGPTLGEVLDEVARQGKPSVVVAPVGFLADHIETLYDLDMEAAAQAKDRGLSFTRVPALGDDPSLVEALAHVVREAFG